ncbi:MAG: hypothetical protein K5905_25090, partial [Roseibium sp.]|uniref:SMODS domain-containing nucleotidyltransferase n=1 Tax=Roseibium sp. TaxID=1936156 RepID=UPI00262B8C4F
AAASHRRSIESRLQTDFNLTRMFRSGSFGHGTSLSVVSDIDYFAIIPTNQLKKDSSISLRKIKESLAARFPNTGVHVDSPAVVVPFANGTQRHEIIPADFVKKHNGFNVYDIPNRYGEWMRASPSAHNSWVNKENNRLDGKLKQLIRLIKYWNYVKSVGLRSFYIELRVTEYAKGESSIIYKHDVRRALNHLSNKGLAAMQDPQGISGYVYPCSGAVKENASSKLSTALSRSTKAIEEERKGNISMSYYWWNKFFDGNFPGYY